MSDLVSTAPLISIAAAIIVAVFAAYMQARQSRLERIADLRRDHYLRFVTLFHGTFRGEKESLKDLVAWIDQISLISDPNVGEKAAALWKKIQTNIDEMGSNFDPKFLDEEFDALLKAMRSELTGKTVSNYKWTKIRSRTYRMENEDTGPQN